jgi:hypothetical protein
VALFTVCNQCASCCRVPCWRQVLVATSTLAWGVNTPAHLVIIKGTEYYDAPSRRYVDFPITDVLQVRPAAVHSAWLACTACLPRRFSTLLGSKPSHCTNLLL